MSEYIITIDDWFFKNVHERYTHFFGCPIKEIVRCRDCKHSYKDVCERPIWGDGEMACVPIEPDGFCKWGERRKCKSAEVWDQWSADDVTCSED